MMVSSSNDNFNTLWIQQLVNQTAMTRAAQAIEQTGRALPCKVIGVNVGTYEVFVTVNFEVISGNPFVLPQITIPKQESQWYRQPTQIGDIGVTVPADTFLGGLVGPGSAPADMSVNYGNLSTLMFVPIGSTSWPQMPDLNKPFVNGPDGAQLGDATGIVALDYDAPSQTVTLCAPGLATIQMNSDGITVQVGESKWTFADGKPSGELTLSNGVGAETHIHSGVQSGGDDTGPMSDPSS